MNNIYHCYIINKHSAYIIAKDSTRAIELFKKYFYENYKKAVVNVDIFKKCVPEDESIIVSPQSEIATKYNIKIKIKERFFCLNGATCPYFRIGKNDSIGFCMMPNCPVNYSVNGDKKINYNGRITKVKYLYDMGERNLRKKDIR